MESATATSDSETGSTLKSAGFKLNHASPPFQPRLPAATHPTTTPVAAKKSRPTTDFAFNHRMAEM